MIDPRAEIVLDILVSEWKPENKHDLSKIGLSLTRFTLLPAKRSYDRTSFNRSTWILFHNRALGCAITPIIGDQMTILVYGQSAPRMRIGSVSAVVVDLLNVKIRGFLRI